MMAQFCEKSFDVTGCAYVKLATGREYWSDFPPAVWKWLQGRDWVEVTVYSSPFDQSYGWDRLP